LNRRTAIIRLPCLATLALGTGARAVRADIYALAGGLQGPAVAVYDASGRFVARTFAGIESVDGITATPDGWVYATGNRLGVGQLGRTPVAGPLGFHTVTDFGENGYNAPGGLAAGPDGSVYATSTRFRTEGVSGIFRFNPADDSFEPVVVQPDAPGPNPFQNFNAAVALSPSGDFYVSRYNLGVERYSAATGELVGLVIRGSAIGGSSYDLDFGPDGNLYLPTAAGIDRFNPQTGALVDHFIPAGTGGLANPDSLTFGRDGLLYVNNPSTASVLRYDAATGAFRDVFITPAEYQRAGLGGIADIVYVVPEPGSPSAAFFTTAAALLRRRRRR
jgi:hypothetical protein